MKTTDMPCSFWAQHLLPDASAASAQEPMNIVFTHHSSASNTFWQAVKKGFDDACAKIQANCNMIFTQTEGSIEQQVGQHACRACRQAGRAADLDRRQQRPSTTIIKEARAAGVIVIAVNVDDTEGAKGNARQAFIGQGFVPAGYSLGKAISDSFPKDGPIKVLVGISAPGQNWSESRGAGVMKFLEEYKAAQRRSRGVVGAHRQRHRPRHHLRPRRRLSSTHILTPPPTSTPASGVPAWRGRCSDRGVEPGKVLMGGFDLVPEVLQQMEKGYIQALVDQQPYMQGFMPVMEVYLSKTVGLAPSDIDTGQGIVRARTRCRSIMELSAQGHALSLRVLLPVLHGEKMP